MCHLMVVIYKIYKRIQSCFCSFKQLSPMCHIFLIIIKDIFCSCFQLKKIFLNLEF